MLPDDTSELWFAAVGGRRSGPFTHAELRARVGAGALDSTTVVWRRGLSDWAPLSRHLAAPVAPAPAGDAGGQTASESGADEAASPQRKPAAFWLGMALMAAGGALYVLLFGAINFARFDHFAGWLHAGAWILALVLTGLSCALIWGRGGNRGAERYSLHSGARVVAVVAATFAIGGSAVLAGVTPVVARIGEARTSFSDFDLVYDPATRTISLSGSIGPGLATGLSRMLETNSGVSTLRVNSPGGLVDEAIRAARLLERRPGLTIEVERECNSACFILFMGAARRLADIESSVGLHATSPITHLPGFAQAAFDEEADGATQYLAERGIPQDLLAEIDAVGPADLKQIDALELLDRSLIMGVTLDGEVLQRDRAKWLWVSHAIRRSGTNTEFADVALALSESQNADVLAASAAVYAAIRSGDAQEMKGAMLMFVPDLVPDLLESADPKVMTDYLRASFGVTDYLVAMETWSECGALFDGKGMTDARSVPQSVAAAEFLALAAAVRSAEQATWIRRPIPTWAAAEGQRVVDAALAQAARIGADTARLGDDRSKCLVLQAFGRQLLALEPVRAVAVRRWLDARSARQ